MRLKIRKDWAEIAYVNKKESAHYLRAIERVLELHENHNGKCLECSVFVDDGITYPCATVKVLNGDV